MNKFISFNQHKNGFSIILIGIIIAIFFGVIASGYFFISKEKTTPIKKAPRETTKEVPAKEVFHRKNISTYLGIWMPSIIYPGLHSITDRESLVALGANIVGIGVEVAYLDDGKFHNQRLTYAKDKARELIKYYKEADLAVWLSLIPVPSELQGEPGPLPENIKEEVLRNYETVVVDFAAIAEEYKVEIFSPMDEPDYKLGVARGSSWGQEILPKVKSVFSGKVLWKGSLSRALDNNQRVDFSGYDIAGFTVFPWAGLQNYAQNVDFYIKTLKKWASEDGVDEIIVAEFGNYAITRISKEEEPEALNTVFERGQGKVNGFIVLDPPKNFGTPIKGSNLENVIKTWFEQLR